jgi:hypothetical protein
LTNDTKGQSTCTAIERRYLDARRAWLSRDYDNISIAAEKALSVAYDAAAVEWEDSWRTE